MQYTFKLTTKYKLPSIYICSESGRVAFCCNNYIFTNIAQSTNEQLSFGLIRAESISNILEFSYEQNIAARTMVREFIRRGIAATL